MLRRCYSQNIDGLEEAAGVSQKKIICAHGSLQYATCCKCKRKVNATELEDNIMNGTVPHCQIPINKNIKINKDHNNDDLSTTGIDSVLSPRISSRKRNRSAISSLDSYQSIYSGIDNDNNVCGGVMKPGITFFGEALNMNVKRSLESDRDKVDALIVIGTSLSV